MDSISSLRQKSRVFLFTFLSIILIVPELHADETKWISIGMLHDWYSSAGAEIEVGRRGLVTDQQDGLQWPALFQYQDMQAAKGLWIGASNYADPLAGGKTYEKKVVHAGPRVLDETSEFMPQKFEMVGKFDHPTVVVDGVLASDLAYEDKVNRVDEDLPTDRMLVNVVNTSIGITIRRKIYAYSNRYHDNYFIYEYTFKNTGIYDADESTHNVTLNDVIFFFQFRYAVAKHLGSYGYNYAPQSATWGHNTMNEILHPQYGDNLRGIYAWHGLHSGYTGDNIGGPNLGSTSITANGFLGGAQFPGTVTLHADKGPNDHSDDTSQPFSAPYFSSDAGVTQQNDQFNGVKMISEYNLMNEGLPDETHAEDVGNGNADEYAPPGETNPGGFSQGIGYGPYPSLAPGDSVRIVLAEGANGISWEKRHSIGSKWFNETTPYILPNGNETSDRNQYKDAWVFTGKDSIKKTFERAIQTWDNDLVIDPTPPPPNTFAVTSGGDRITLEWAKNAESYDNFGGYRVYRSLHTPDTTFEMIFECGDGTNNPVVNLYEDKSAQRGFEYYYYITTYDDGSVNTIKPGARIESSLFWTKTSEPAYLRRQPGDNLEDIRIVPNPFNINARSLQFGQSGPDRIMFYNLPPKCDIQIYTERGDLIKTIHHTDGSGDEPWDSVTSSRQVVVSGIYIAYIKVTEDHYDPQTGRLMFKKGVSTTKKLIIVR